MRPFALRLVALALAVSVPALAEEPTTEPAKAAVADKPATSEPEKPKDSPLPFAMFMAGAGAGTAIMGGYLAFAVDDTASARLGVPLLIAGGLATAGGVTLILVGAPSQQKTARTKPRVQHRVSLLPTGASYSLRF